jgi:hypothetical protein
VEEIRDYVLIVALILVALVTLVTLTALSLIAWKVLKGVRWARRQHDDRLSPLVASAGERLSGVNEGLASGAGVADLALAAYRFARSKRKRRKPTRAQRARAALSQLRSRAGR